MHPTRTALVVGLIALAIAGPALAVPIADSQAEFSGVQGQDSWSYGFFNLTAKGSAYAAGDFVAFDSFDAGGLRWVASDGQVGANNNDFLSINQAGGHPNGLGPSSQDSIIWAMRRYTSEVSGPISIDFDLHKANTINRAGGGITGHIFVDGVEIFSALIDNADGVGLQQSILRGVNVGSLIDFAIDPHGSTPLAGTDGLDSARADGSHFSAVIERATIPEPSTALLLAASLFAVWRTKRTLRGDGLGGAKRQFPRLDCHVACGSF